MLYKSRSTLSVTFCMMMVFGVNEKPGHPKTKTIHRKLVVKVAPDSPRDSAPFS